jgi:hypothetical protein
MEVAVDHVYRGSVAGATRTFTARVGEWGLDLPAAGKPVVVSEEAGKVVWSPIVERDGKMFVDPKRLPGLGGVATAAKGDSALVALDEVLARGQGAR